MVGGKFESFEELKRGLEETSAQSRTGAFPESFARGKPVERVNPVHNAAGWAPDFSALKMLELEKRNIERTRNPRLISKLVPPLDKKIEEEKLRLANIRRDINAKRVEEERKSAEESLRRAEAEKSRIDALEAAKLEEALGLLRSGIVSRCPSCDWGQNVTDCQSCKGSGRSSHKELIKKAMAAVCDNRSPNCPRCAGTGIFTSYVRVEDFPACKRCNGQGWGSTPCSNCERGLVVREGESFPASLYDHLKRQIQS